MIPFINNYTCTKRQIPIILNKFNKKNINPILYHINENKRDHIKNYNTIIENINKYPKKHISIKLSSLNIENNENQCLKYLENIMEDVKKNDCKLLIDAENYKLQEKINLHTNYLIEKYNNKNLYIYKTYQMYKKNECELIKDDLHKAIINKTYLGIKLVRGAYLYKDKKFNNLCNSYHETNLNYNDALHYIIYSNILYSNNIKLMVATHNVNSIFYALKLSKDSHFNGIEYAQFMGMSDNLTKIISRDKKNNVYKFIPYGDLNDSLIYLTRTLY